ncbi:MAG: hypothetical protein RBU37_22515 [Myxococcota bacterium]|jgi:hypothetical protein|nr:hypothetical protein [Myxococcota bacterium]
MKKLSWISLILGLVAVFAAGYALLESYPNYVAAVADVEADVDGLALDRLASTKELFGTVLIFGMWGAGGLALILGLLSGLKHGRRVGFVGAGLGAVGALMSVFTPMLQW